MNSHPKISVRNLRRQAVPAITQLMNNDAVTQRKVTDLKQRVDGHIRRMDRVENIVLAHVSASFWQRMRWVFKGTL